MGSVAMNFRGAGGIPNRLARTYHAGDTADLAAVMSVLSLRLPHRPLAAVGYSLGGNVLLKWLGETGASARIAAACAVSAPFDLAACSAQLDCGFSRVYRNRLRNELVANLVAKERVLRGSGAVVEADRIHALGDLSAIRTFREYDDRVVAPLHGFRHADDYYARSSARGFLTGIAVSTLVIHALDDPFMTPSVVPSPDRVPACVQLSVSARGGHVGFVHGSPSQPRYWLEEVIPEFFIKAFAQPERVQSAKE
jgi:predicted alpha/beta-fold hydrolase